MGFPRYGSIYGTKWEQILREIFPEHEYLPVDRVAVNFRDYSQWVTGANFNDPDIEASFRHFCKNQTYKYID